MIDSVYPDPLSLYIFTTHQTRSYCPALLLHLLMAPTQECAAVEPLKYQTWILKVSIHCEGCSKKVKKVLQSMEGVYKTSVDPQQHKVVVTGNVGLEVLLKRLLKAGKHAEIWPESKPGEESRTLNSSNKSKKKNTDKPNEPSDGFDNRQIASNNGSANESPPPPGKKKQGEKAAAAAPGGGGKKKPRKTHKDNNGSSDGNDKSGGGGAAGQVQAAQQETNKKAEPSAGVSLLPPPPPLQGFNYPFYATTSPLPYLVSYSSMQPSMSCAGAYYSAMPSWQSSHVYSAPLSEDYSHVCGIM